jgi:hypothetical protein
VFHSKFFFVQKRDRLAIGIGTRECSFGDASDLLWTCELETKETDGYETGDDDMYKMRSGFGSSLETFFRLLENHMSPVFAFPKWVHRLGQYDFSSLDARGIRVVYVTPRKNNFDSFDHVTERLVDEEDLLIIGTSNISRIDCIGNALSHFQGASVEYCIPWPTDDTWKEARNAGMTARLRDIVENRDVLQSMIMIPPNGKTNGSHANGSHAKYLLAMKMKSDQEDVPSRGENAKFGVVWSANVSEGALGCKVVGNNFELGVFIPSVKVQCPCASGKKRKRDEDNIFPVPVCIHGKHFVNKRGKSRAVPFHNMT